MGVPTSRKKLDPHLAFPPAAERELHRKAILLIIVFFVFHFMMLTLRAYAVELDHQREIANGRLILTPMGAILCYAMFLILRRWREHNFVTQAVVAAALSSGCALVHGWIWSFFLFEIDPAVYPTTLGKLVYQSLYWYMFYFAWTTAYLGLSYSITVREQARHSATLLAEAQEAKIRALRYQINPHFLFNTLNSIAQLVAEDKAKAEEMVLNLSEFFRTSLTVDPMDEVRLADEIALQELYLTIEKVRFPDRLSVIVDVPEELAGALVPSLILQPLVENAVKHGVARSETNTRITISAAADGDRLALRVADDAAHDAGSPLGNKGAGVGLGNVRNRLAARYGDDFSLEAGAADGKGFAVSITLPLRF